MKRMLSLLALAGVLAAVGCSEGRTPSGPTVAGDKAVNPIAEMNGFTAMTQNLYVGADMDPLLKAFASADPKDDVPALHLAIATLQQTDYVARIRAVARRIEQVRPQVVGLQEVSKIDIEFTGVEHPVSIHQDFLKLLLARLADRGLHYVVAGQVQNFVATPRPEVSLADYDVILVDADRASFTAKKDERLYRHNLGVIAPGVDLQRGFVQVRIESGGHHYAVVSTHLESGDTPQMAQLRRAQVDELFDALLPGVPTILMGDLNDVPGSPMYGAVTRAGFTDVWAQVRPGAGYTCCSMADLSNATTIFSQRLDYIFTRGIDASLGIQKFGDTPAAMIQGPAFMIWPSDHAGLALHIGEYAPPVAD